MSEEEDFDESEGCDFSASEEEWKPGKDAGAGSSDFESDEDDEDNDESFDPADKRKSKSRTAGRSCFAGRGRGSKVLTSRVPQQLNVKVTSAHPSQSTSKTVRSYDGNPEDSDSSGDNYLVDPASLDVKSSFFDVIPKKDHSQEEAPKFDCNAGMRLSDSEDEDDEISDNKLLLQDEIKKEKLNIVNINQFSADKLKQVHDYTKNLEEAKAHLKNFKSDAFKEEKKLDVNDLLAMGESSTSVGKKSHKNKSSPIKRKHESDSDWEDVEDGRIKEMPVKDALQITVQLQQREKRTKNQEDLEAKLKRQLNRVIKENQVYLHKVSLLCHIAHGFFCNRMLNTKPLMADAHKLLPGPNSYPNGQTDIKYFEQMCRWFKTIFSVREDTMSSRFKTRPRLDISLQLQIKAKEVLCKKDLVLIFITMLRSMGIQCRMVMNLRVVPLKPAQSDLCSLKQKKDDSKEVDKKKNDKKSTDKKEHSYSLKEKISKNEKTVHKEKIKSKDKKVDDVLEKVASPLKKESRKKVSSEDKNSSKSPEKVSRRVTRRTSRDSVSSKSDDISSSSKTASDKKSSERIPATRVNSGEEGEPSHFIRKDSNTRNDEKPSASKTPKKLEENKIAKTKGRQKKNQKVEALETIPEEKINTVSSKQNDNKPTTRVTRARNKKLKLEEIPQMDGADDHLETESSGKKDRKAINLKKLKLAPTKNKEIDLPKSIKTQAIKKSKQPPRDSDDDFVPCPPKKAKSVSKDKGQISKVKRIDKRVLSTDVDDEEEPKTLRNKMDIWVEVYAEADKRWIAMDLFKGKVDCVDLIKKTASSPIVYVFAWNNDNTIKDVSARYCAQLHTVTRKQRVEEDWLHEALKRHYGKKTSRDKAEDRELDRIHMEKPLPQTIAEFKNHPLYALERHLLKFEAIYPPNALTLGFVRGEPIYARECVHSLHSREIWLKSARVVKPGEQPYKIVKARPKWDKFTNTVIKDQPLEIFGYWQTKQYDPPTAENGIVPRNEYGNVELFKKCMLPKKTVHIQLPGIAKVCKKLKIDCAPAVVGFDFHQGLCHPLIDGFVICEEFEEKVLDEWNREQERAEQREEEKYNQRVYGNWKKLIRGLLIREKLKRKYNFGFEKKE